MNKQTIRRQQQTRRQCKPNNTRNEHDKSGLLQKNRKPKQQVGNEQVENKKTMTKNRTTQTQRNNARNEHDKSGKLVLFVRKYLVCNFSTFDTTCVNYQKQYKNQYPLANIKKFQQGETRHAIGS